MSTFSLRRVALVAAGAAVAIFGVFALLLVLPSGSYIFLPDAAHPVAPLVSVKGGHDPKGPGGIYFVDVFVRKASLLEKLLPVVRADGARVHPASDVRAPGVSDAARRKADLRDMTRSQEIAAAVALRALGHRVIATPTGALIEAVDPSAPAGGKLQPGDIVFFHMHSYGPGHEGMYIGNGLFIHAPHTGDVVKDLVAVRSGVRARLRRRRARHRLSPGRRARPARGVLAPHTRCR